MTPRWRGVLHSAFHDTLKSQRSYRRNTFQCGAVVSARRQDGKRERRKGKRRGPTISDDARAKNPLAVATAKHTGPRPPALSASQ